jgi:outer membrane receptor protein involved in Fe transport
MALRRVLEISLIVLAAVLCGGTAFAQQALPNIDIGSAHRPSRASAELTTPPKPRPAPAIIAQTPPASTPQPAAVEPPSTAASEKFITGEQINAIPFTRPGEALEVVPGLVVSQHSGEGKANQYNLRGFQLDHGTDLALWLDGMPLNMRTHGHGQGYADANFLIPELLSSIDVRKGPYYADEGDFSSAGAVHMQYRDQLEKGLISITGGHFGYARSLVAKSWKVGEGDLLTALEANVYDGPWVRPDEVRKINGVMRWSTGTQDNGFAITAMAYANRWYSTDQIPQRAVTQNLIPLWGNLDSSDGGDTTRFSLSTRWSQTEGDHSTRVEAYAIRSSLELYNDFTYFLTHSDVGDQFRQFDRRTVLGFNAQHAYKYRLLDFPMETRFGVQTRYDDIRVGLQETAQRQIYDTIRNDWVNEASVGVWTDTTLHWTPWLRTTGGIRLDYFHANVYGLQTPFGATFDPMGGDSIWTAPANSGGKASAITSPKAAIVLGPFYKTEMFLNFGEGFHSTDARGTVTNLNPIDGTQVAPNPLLVKSRGAEIGFRTKALENLDSSVSFWWLNFDSENQFEGDTGNTTFGRPSRRYGVEWTNHYSPTPWIHVDADLALVHARYRGVDTLQWQAYGPLVLDPAAAAYGTFIGNAPGNFIPESLGVVGSFGLEVGDKTGLFGALKYRYTGGRPLTEDGALKGPANGVVNIRAGYRWDNGWSLHGDLYNLFNSRSDQITYGYGSLLRSDALFGQCQAGMAPQAVCAIGVMDKHFHPTERPSLRVTLSGPLPF